MEIQIKVKKKLWCQTIINKNGCHKKNIPIQGKIANIKYINMTFM